MSREVANTAYSNLKAEMARKDITIESMAQMLGIHRNSVANKLNGASSFTIEEAMKIRSSFLPELEYEYLFAPDRRGE